MKTNTDEWIKEKAKELFSQHGVKSISMDDIARQSGLSKKTIYQFFSNKNELVYAIVEDFIQFYEQLFEISRNSARDAVEEVLKQDNALMKMWSGIRPSFIYELEKYFPDVFELLNEYKAYILDSIVTNLKRGKEENVYRDDIDIAFISDLRMHQLANVMKPELLISYPLNTNQLAGEFTVLYLHSITTEKGKKLLYKYLNQNRQ